MPAITKPLVTLQSLSRASKPALGTRYLAVLLRLASLARQRRHLAELPDLLLKDVGISPDDARVEAHRKIWDVPDHWRK